MKRYRVQASAVLLFDVTAVDDDGAARTAAREALAKLDPDWGLDAPELPHGRFYPAWADEDDAMALGKIRIEVVDSEDIEHPCGRCGKGEAAGAAGLCAACDSEADEQETIHERAHAGVSDPDTCDRGARCPMSIVPLTAGEAAALLAGDEAAWRAFYAEARAWTGEDHLTPAEIAEEKNIRRGEEEMQDSPRRRS